MVTAIIEQISNKYNTTLVVAQFLWKLYFLVQVDFLKLQKILMNMTYLKDQKKQNF